VPNEEPLVDWPTFDAMAQITGVTDSPALLHQIVSRFQHESAQDLGAVRTAMGREVAVVKFHCHKLKGALSSLTFRRAARYIALLESAPEAVQAADVDQLETLLGASLDALAERYPQLSVG